VALGVRETDGIGWVVRHILSSHAQNAAHLSSKQRKRSSNGAWLSMESPESDILIYMVIQGC
jgi:hypothetical protein